MRWRLAACVLGLAAITVMYMATSSSAQILQGGGGSTTSKSPSFVSGPIAKGADTDNTIHFDLRCDFDITDVTVTFVDSSGNPVTGNNALSGIKVTSGTPSTSNSNSASGATGSCNKTVPKNTSFSVDVTCSASNALLKFVVSFSTGPAHQIQLPGMDVGANGFLAFPLLQGGNGARIRLTNVNADPVTFGSFQLSGAEGVTISSVSAEGFTADIAGSGRSFTMTGSLATAASVDLLVNFSGAPTERGALLGFCDVN